MAINYNTLKEIQRKAENGIKLDIATPEKQKVYDQYQTRINDEIKRKAQSGIALESSNAYKSGLYSQYSKPVQAQTPATQPVQAPQALQAPNMQDMAAQTQGQLEGRVNSMIDQQKAAQLAQLRASRDRAVGQLNQQKAEVAPQYAGMRNQSDVVNAQNVKKLREAMSANGLAGSGENVTGSVGLAQARQSALNGLNLQEQQTNNDFNRQISDLNNPADENALISQLEAQRMQALLGVEQTAYDRAYQQRRDTIGDNRFDQQFNYQTGRDNIADQRYTDETTYNRGRDTVGDQRYNDQQAYQVGRDKVADSQFDQNLDFQKSQFKSEEDWRKYTYNNMSASEKAQLAQSASQFGEEMAWKLYETNYNGEIAKAQSQAQINAYSP